MSYYSDSNSSETESESDKESDFEYCQFVKNINNNIKILNNYIYNLYIKHIKIFNINKLINQYNINIRTNILEWEYIIQSFDNIYNISKLSLIILKQLYKQKPIYIIFQNNINKSNDNNKIKLKITNIFLLNINDMINIVNYYIKSIINYIIFNEVNNNNFLKQEKYIEFYFKKNKSCKINSNINNIINIPINIKKYFIIKQNIKVLTTDDLNKFNKINKRLEKKRIQSLPITKKEKKNIIINNKCIINSKSNSSNTLQFINNKKYNFINYNDNNDIISPDTNIYGTNPIKDSFLL